MLGQRWEPQPALNLGVEFHTDWPVASVPGIKGKETENFNEMLGHSWRVRLSSCSQFKESWTEVIEEETGREAFGANGGAPVTWVLRNGRKGVQQDWHGEHLVFPPSHSSASGTKGQPWRVMRLSKHYMRLGIWDGRQTWEVFWSWTAWVWNLLFNLCNMENRRMDITLYGRRNYKTTWDSSWVSAAILATA